jgi:hypothetical protein
MMSNQFLPFRNEKFMSGLISETRRGHSRYISNFAEDIAQSYQLRVKVDRANREFKEETANYIDNSMLLQVEVMRGAKTVLIGDTCVLAEEDITTVFNQLRTKAISERWYECFIENMQENERLRLQEKTVRDMYYALYHQKGRPLLTRNNGYYTSRMDWYARRLFSQESSSEDGALQI